MICMRLSLRRAAHVVVASSEKQEIRFVVTVLHARRFPRKKNALCERKER
jgi:hypothetical protein